MKTEGIYKLLQKAVLKLEEAQDFPKTEPMRESTIQRFEYTFELSWKLMSSALKDQSMEVYGVKNIIRAAAKLQLINNVELWFTYAYARNQASHIYREDVAQEVYEVATGGFLASVKKLLQLFKTEYI